MNDDRESAFTDRAVYLEYAWRGWRYMLTGATVPQLLCVSAQGILRLGTFVDHSVAEETFWNVVTLTIHDADTQIAEMRIKGTHAAVVLDGPADGRAHLAIRSTSRSNFAHCFDSSHDALDAWAELAAELAVDE